MIAGSRAILMVMALWQLAWHRGRGMKSKQRNSALARNPVIVFVIDVVDSFFFRFIRPNRIRIDQITQFDRALLSTVIDV